MRLRLTIDTNCINVRQGLVAMNELEALAARDAVSLATATAILEDLAFDQTELAQARRDRANRLLQARHAFMVGDSHVGGPDVIGGPNVYAYVDRIAAALGDGQPWEALDGNTQRDVLHIAAHYSNGRDAFVTRDGGILAHAAQMANLGVRVLSPEEALALVRTGNPAP